MLTARKGVSMVLTPGDTIKCFNENEIISYKQYIKRHGYDCTVEGNVITVVKRPRKEKKHEFPEPRQVERNYDPMSHKPKGVKTPSGVRFTPM